MVVKVSPKGTTKGNALKKERDAVVAAEAERLEQITRGALDCARAILAVHDLESRPWSALDDDEQAVLCQLAKIIMRRDLSPKDAYRHSQVYKAGRTPFADQGKKVRLLFIGFTKAVRLIESLEA